MASVNPSIRLVMSSSFKGGSRLWSNRFHFNGGTPADATHWNTLGTNIANVLKTCLRTSTTIVEAVGYAAGSDVPVNTQVMSVAGTYSPGANDRATPLQCAALLRWSTASRSTKNHPIYAFSYVHDVVYDATVGGNDKLASGMKTALQTFATDWVSGFSDGTLTLVRATPAGHVATGSIVEEYITHRDFPYRSSV